MQVIFLYFKSCIFYSFLLFNLQVNNTQWRMLKFYDIETDINKNFSATVQAPAAIVWVIQMKIWMIYKTLAKSDD